MSTNSGSASSSESSLPGSGEEDWRQKCLTMEASLTRFKQQAARIRGLLAEKMQVLEERTKDAETRATQAEEQVAVLERRLHAQNGKPDEMDKKLYQLETRCENQEKEIQHLQQQLHEQQQLRYKEAKIVEEKSSKIKEWVTKKWKNLEAANRQLESENSLLQSQVQILRDRLQALPTATARAIHRLSVQSSDTDSTVPPVPQRPTDSVIARVQRHLAADMDVTTDNRQAAPPRVRIERRMFTMAGSSSTASSMTGSEELLDAAETIPVSMTTTASPTPRSVCALATLPRRKRDAAMLSSRHEHNAHVNDSRLLDATGMRAVQQGAPLFRSKPPTPPMRRLPSWESRIYAIANVGLSMPHLETDTKRESTFPVTDGLYTDQMYKDLSVPVYTTVKGRAAQIRSCPFTGDTDSDTSSDDEPYSNVATTTGHITALSGPRIVPGASSSSMSGIIRRAVSSHSVGSETSSDYALPPDELPTDSSDTSEPEHKLLKCSADSTCHTKSLERSGFLTKLGAKRKSFCKRFFVLHNSELLYYKTANVSERARGRIELDGQTRVYRSSASPLTFQVATEKRVYHLSAESSHDMQQWIRVLHNVLRKQTCEKVMNCTRGQEVMKSWLLKTKKGRSRRCWGALVGRFLVYYKHPEDKMPLGQIPLRDALVQEVEQSCESESESDDSSSRPSGYTLAIRPAKQRDATYLRVTSKCEKESWLYHLTVASGGGLGTVGTEYEKLISKLMEGDPGCIYWKHPTLLYSRDLITSPLTTLPNEKLCRKSLDLYRTCQQFMNLPVDTSHLEYHVSLAQSIMELCVLNAPLQNELYCQLIKLTSPYLPQHKTHVPNFLLCGGFMCDSASNGVSMTASHADLTDPKVNSAGRVHLQGWQLLAMAVSLFVPSHSVLWYLREHLQRYADSRSEIGQYAIFCQRALQRAEQQGSRETRPSRMEVLSILLRNPYHHSQPLSIPVHFINATYQVVGFDGSTTVAEFLSSLNCSINMRDCHLSGFTLFTDDPAAQELEHCLQGHLKLCDVISKWEQAFLHHASLSGRPDMSRTVKLTYKNRLYYKRSASRLETDRERLLLAYQANEEVVQGRVPVSRELATELAALLSQIEFGDFRLPGEVTPGVVPCDTPSMSTHMSQTASDQLLPVCVERFYPRRYRDGTPEGYRVLEQMIAEKWLDLKGRPATDCVRIYLTVLRKWPFFGAKLFYTKVKYSNTGHDNVWLAIQDDSVAILEYPTLNPISVYSYGDVLTFGGFRNDFLLVINQKSATCVPSVLSTTDDRLIFSLRKPKMLELTMLMASYINSRWQHRTKSVESLEKRDMKLTLSSSTTQMMI